jgi:hypothetical protein
MRNGGDRSLHSEIFELLEHQKERGESTHMLFTGSSITATGYFSNFVQYLEQREHRNITVVNTGQGASDTTYHLYCVNYNEYTPDIIFADLRFTNANSDSQTQEALFRKLLSLRRRDGGSPLLISVLMGLKNDKCDFPHEPSTSDFAKHYGFTILDKLT